MSLFISLFLFRFHVLLVALVTENGVVLLLSVLSCLKGSFHPAVHCYKHVSLRVGSFEV